MLLRIITAHKNSHATHVMQRARALSTKMNNDKADAVAIALLGFNDLESSVTPIFLFRNRFHLQQSPHCPKMNKNSMWEVVKIPRIFCPRDMESCHLAALRRVNLWSLNATLFVKEPQQLAKFP